jgi:hypothetical protein
MTKKTKHTQNEQKTPPKEECVLTKEDFLKALKKATRPVSPKASPVKGKKKTSG